MTRWAWIAVGGSLGLAAILTVALVIAIAGGGDDGKPGTDSTPPAGDVQTFGGPLGGGMPPEVEECLSEQGVEPPGSHSAPPDEAQMEELQRALEECGLPAPQIVTPGS